MKRVRIEDVPWLEWSSPNGRFHGHGRQISEALGAALNAPIGDGGHPFDLELGRLQPGKAGSPFHSHSAQWELFIILSGNGRVRHGRSERPIRAGEAVLHPPGEAHQLINTGPGELTYYLVADNPLSEVWHYPDSGKLGWRPDRRFYRDLPVPYWLGEDDPATAEPGPVTADAAPGLARFAEVAALPVEEKRSPSGRFHSYCRDLSLALGGQRNLGTSHGGHPFDVQFRRVPAGAAICPFHLHLAQWEMFVILQGCGQVRLAGGVEPVQAGDALIHPPEEAHQLRADDDSELECMIVTDNPILDAFYYPDSDKWGLRPPGKFFRMTEVNYFEGED